jgi:DNA-directed RNA polymerase specialized sigma24 family protein
MQVVITLKYVANLKTESIAKALGITTDGIDKILARAKQRIRMENIFLKSFATATEKKIDRCA